MARSGIMLARPFEQRLLDNMGWPVIVQPKLNGQRLRVDNKGDSPRLFSSQSTEMTRRFPELVKELQDLPRLDYDGEMYCHGMDARDISGICRTESPHSERSKLKFTIFDYISQDSQVSRMYHLDTLRPYIRDHIDILTSFISNSFEQIITFKEIFITAGYEGVIIRDPRKPYHISAPNKSPFLLKWKDKKRRWFEIIGTTEEISIDGIPKDSLGAFIVRTKGGETFRVGTGFLLAERVYWWQIRDSFIGMKVEVEFPEYTKYNIPHMPVFIGIVKDHEIASKQLLQG